jgi:transcriptional regulator with XRE-family HTH domain
MTSTTTPTSVAEFIAERLAAIDKTQRQIATECGLENPNVITMFKQGLTKLPLNRIGPLAKALDVDPAHLLRLAMLEYMPDTWAAIENVMQSTLLSANEFELIRAYRAATGDSDAVATVIKRDAVIAVVAATAVAD